MVYYSRALLSGRQKAAFSLAVIVLAIYITINPRAMEAFLAFCFGGVVPGTDIVLAPEVLLAGVAGLSTALLAGGILRMKLRSTRRRRREMRIPVRVVSEKRIPVTAVPETLPAVYDEPVAEAVSGHEKRTFFAVSVLRALRDGLALIAIMLGRGIRGVYRGARAVTSAVGRGTFAVLSALTALTNSLIRLVFTAISKAVFALGVLSLALIRSAWLTGRWTAGRAVEFWRWAKPHLRKFDEWLELNVRRFETWLRRTLGRYEWARLAHAILRESKKSLTDFSAKIQSFIR